MITITPKGQVILTVEMCPSELVALQGAIIDLIAAYNTTTDSPLDTSCVYWVSRFLLEGTFLSTDQMTRFANGEATRKQKAA